MSITDVLVQILWEMIYKDSYLLIDIDEKWFIISLDMAIVQCSYPYNI